MDLQQRSGLFWSILFAHTCNIIDGCAVLCAMVKWGKEEASGVLQQENCIE